MTKVVALQTWSNGTITMDEKSVLDIDDALATDLIAKGIVAGAATYFGGGGSGGGVLVVTVTTSGETKTMDKTWQEIADADVVHVKDGEYRAIVNKVYVDVYGHKVYLGAAASGMTTIYNAPSADGYPVSNTK